MQTQTLPILLCKKGRLEPSCPLHLKPRQENETYCINRYNKYMMLKIVNEKLLFGVS